MIATHAKTTNRSVLLIETLRLIAVSSKGIKSMTRIKALCELATMIVGDTTKLSSARRWCELLDMTLEALKDCKHDTITTTNAMRYIIRLTIDHYLNDEHQTEYHEEHVKIPMIA